MSGPQTKFRTPISYYGGKQQMAHRILPMIPEHTMYIEPFCGGSAIFFEKEKEKFEVINDKNSELINLYRIMQTRFTELQQEIKGSLHSRQTFYDAIKIYNHPEEYSEVKRAWAIWYGLKNAFNNDLSGGFKTNKSANMRQSHATLFENGKLKFDERIKRRLEGTTIECRDAIEIIKDYDRKTHFFYIDPPYIGTFMGHYDDYQEEDFERLLQALSTLKGKFILSCFPNDILTKYTEQNGWYTDVRTMRHSAGSGIVKNETLTANYVVPSSSCSGNYIHVSK